LKLRKKLNAVDWAALVLLIIGGLNWGLVGLFRLDLAALVLGESIIARAVYLLVGISAIYTLVLLAKKEK
jgi:uncharacterized protein